MYVRSFKVLSQELKLLRLFYDTTCSAYEVAFKSWEPNLNSPEAKSFRPPRKKQLKKQASQLQNQQVKVEAMLRELILVRAISALESFLTDAVRDVFVVTKVPFMVKSVRIDMSQEELIANNTPTKIYNRIIGKETRQLTSGGFNEFIKYYKKRFDIDLATIDPGYKKLNEYHDRRHILVHRLGLTDNMYRKKYGTDEKKLTVEPEYVEQVLSDISEFAEKVRDLVQDFIETHAVDTSLHNARLVVDVRTLKEDVPEFLKPDFQYWADDEYVVMSDILVTTGPGEEGFVRYFFNGSDRALHKLRRYFIVGNRKSIIRASIVADLTKKVRRKKVPQKFEDQVRSLLPEQPWPTGIHKKIAAELGLANSVVSGAIDQLIAKGDFKNQIDGKVIEVSPSADWEKTPPC